jgi:hypothetical protein
MRKIVIALLVSFGTMCFADSLILNDGSRHEGTLQSATASYVSFRENGKTSRYSRSRIQSIEFSGTSATSYNDQPSSSTYRHSSTGSRSSVTLPAGSEIVVMPNENIDSANANEGQSFSADVAEDVRNSAGTIIIPKGSEAELVLRKVASQGTVSGASELVLDLQSLRVNGRRYTVSTEDVSEKGKEGIGANKRTATMVGGGAVLGTLIGAIAGGGKGAAIGAATGAAAGGATQVLTRGKAVKVPAESKLRFKLDEPLRLNAAY